MLFAMRLDASKCFSTSDTDACTIYDRAPETYRVVGEHEVVWLQEVVLQRLSDQVAVGVARAVADGEQHPQEEGVRRHLLQDVPHLHILLALFLSGLDLGRVHWLIFNLTAFVLLACERLDS